MPNATNPLEFYATPDAFTRWLFTRLRITGTIFEPCVGDGAIVRASATAPGADHRQWATNDLDRSWGADAHLDATSGAAWPAFVDWTVSNPPFNPALDIIEHAIRVSRVGVAMHLRASIHEVLKTNRRRTWMREHTPTGILWLPRFAYQRSAKTGEWSTDSVCACWVIWLAEPRGQFIDYAPESVLDDLDRETPAYRARMDALMAARRAA